MVKDDLPVYRSFTIPVEIALTSSRYVILSHMFSFKEYKVMGKRSFFWTLAKDPTANTIVISAAAMVPLIGMVGGAVDASRYYMTTTRLQAACDAGALAARRAMDDDEFNGTHKQLGRNFFDQNYEDGLFGLENLSRDYTSDGDGEVDGAASGRLPASLMQIFGFGEFNVSVSCSAEINISNTDVMFVLDVTGSMNCAPGTAGGCSTEQTDSKIGSLRSAVLTFYDTVDAATSVNAQVRYGVVPYSSNVNVGASLDPSWMAQDPEYQTRVAVFTPDNWVFDETVSSNRTGTIGTQTDIGVSTTTWEGVETFDDCVDLAFSQHFDIYNGGGNTSGLTLVSSTSTGDDTREVSYTGNIQWKVLDSFDSGTYFSGSERCVIDYEEKSYEADGEVTFTEVNIGNQFDYWDYDEHNVSDLGAGLSLASLYGQTGTPAGVVGTIDLPTGTGGVDTTHTWNGCIEEASTDEGQSVFSPLPAAANDLNINLVPSNEQERWKPALASLIHYRFDSGGNWSTSQQDSSDDFTTVQGADNLNCPKAAQRLTTMTRADLENYISAANGFVADGSTYHDFGMIWGARFIAPNGIFSADNSAAPNGDAIARHIVFMTDGTQSTSNTTYGLYGIEWWDRRVTTDGSGTQLATNHAARFQAACQAARDENITVWVVAFGTTLTTNLSTCASPGRAYSASDEAALTQAFTEIAQQIAALRLTS